MAVYVAVAATVVMVLSSQKDEVSPQRELDCSESTSKPVCCLRYTHNYVFGTEQ